MHFVTISLALLAAANSITAALTNSQDLHSLDKREDSRAHMVADYLFNNPKLDPDGIIREYMYDHLKGVDKETFPQEVKLALEAYKKTGINTPRGMDWDLFGDMVNHAFAELVKDPSISSENMLKKMQAKFQGFSRGIDDESRGKAITVARAQLDVCGFSGSVAEAGSKGTGPKPDPEPSKPSSGDQGWSWRNTLGKIFGKDSD